MHSFLCRNVEKDVFIKFVFEHFILYTSFNFSNQFNKENYVKMNRILKCPYTVFCGSLLEEHKRKLEELNSTIKTLQSKNTDLTDLSKHNSETIVTLQEIIAKLKEDEKKSPHSTKLLLMQLELNKLDAENVELKSNLEIFSMKSTSLEAEMYEYKSRMDYLQINNTQLEEKVDNLTAEKEKIIRDYENRINSFKVFKQQASDLKNTLDKMLIKMSTIKSHFLKSQSEKAQLLQERQDLVIRAAAGFENLTPRPNYQQLCTDKNLNMGSLLPKSEKKKKTTSIFIVDNLLNKICEYQAKIALMDSELKDRRKQNVNSPQSQQSSVGPRKPSIGQPGPKSSFNQRMVGSISPNKPSKLITYDLEKKSKFVTIGTEEEILLKSPPSNNLDSPPKFQTNFDFKLEPLKKEEEEVIVSNEKEDIKETENIIMEIIESKKMIEQFEVIKTEGIDK